MIRLRIHSQRQRRRLGIERLDSRLLLAFSYVLNDLGTFGREDLFEDDLPHWGINDYGEVVGLHESGTFGPPTTGGGGFVWVDENENGFMDQQDYTDESPQSEDNLFNEKRFLHVDKETTVGFVRIVDINDQGHTVGTIFDEDLRQRLVIWNRDGEVIKNPGPLVGAPLTPIVGGALSINDRGDVLDQTGNQLIPAIGEPIDLDAAFQADTLGIASLILTLDLDDKGRLLVSGSGPDGSSYYVWTPGSPPVETGILPIGTGAINNHGHAILSTLIDGNFTTVLWKGPEEAPLDLRESLLRPDINDHGQVIGTRVTASSATPYVWDFETGLIDVNTLIDRPGAHGGTSSRISVTHVMEINNFGQIVAVGCDLAGNASTSCEAGERHAYTLSPRLGLDRWWTTAGQESIDLTWTVQIVDQERSSTDPTLDEDARPTRFQLDAQWGMPSTVTVLSNGSTPNMPVTPIGNTANLDDRIPGTYQIKVASLTPPAQPATQAASFQIESSGRNRQLNTFLVADHADTFQGMTYPIIQRPEQATAVAELSLITRSVKSIRVTDSGFGYTSAPNVTIDGATAEAVVVDGRVTSINVTDGSFGFLTAPIVQIDPPSTTEATIATHAGADSLIAAFAPVLHMHAMNTYDHPYAVEQTFGSPDTPYFENPGWCQGLPDRGDRSRDTGEADRRGRFLENLNLRRFYTAMPQRGMDTPPPTDSPCSGSNADGNAKIYASINTREFNPDTEEAYEELAINYHFHYPRSNWNQFEGANGQLGVNEHEGDWEGITVFLRRDDSADPWEPDRIAYGQHIVIEPAGGFFWYTDGGQMLDWSDPRLQFAEGKRPFVFVSQGGHASYPVSGRTLWPRNQYDVGNLPFTAFEAEERHDGTIQLRDVATQYLPRLGEVDPDDEQWEWLVYPGRWGRMDIRIADDAGDDGPRGPVFIKRGVTAGFGPDGIGRRWLDPWGWSEDQTTRDGHFTPAANVERFADLTRWTTVGNVSIIDDGSGSNPVVQLSESSDAAIQRTVTLPEDVLDLFLTFDYAVTQPGDGDTAQVAVNGQQVWSRELTDQDGRELQSGELIDLSDFMGQTADLEVRLVSQGTVNSQFWVDDLVVLSSVDDAPAEEAAVLDVTGNGAANPFQDGILMVRYMLGQPDANLQEAGLIPDNATRTTGAAIRTHLDTAGTSLDANGDGRVSPFEDGILIVRYLLGQPDANLEDPALIPAGSTRTTGAMIRQYLQTLLPPAAAGELTASQLVTNEGGEGESRVSSSVEPSDVDGDGLLTTRDAPNMMNEIARGGSVGPDAWSKFDANQDGDVTVRDALLVMNRLAEQIDVSATEIPIRDSKDGASAKSQVVSYEQHVQTTKKLANIPTGRVDALHAALMNEIDSVGVSGDVQESMSLDDVIELLSHR